MIFKKMILIFLYFFLLPKVSYAENCEHDYMFDGGYLKWHGICVNGKPKGKGTLKFYKEKKLLGTCSAELDEREEFVRKNCLFENGDKSYEKIIGSILYMEFSYSTGEVYKGEWKNNKMNGQGVMTYPSGRKYSGKWEDGKKNGSGVLIQEDGGKYTGDFKDDLVSGKGEFHYANGNKYIGEFSKNMRNGRGEMVYFNGTKYSGEFVNDLAHGKGELINPGVMKYTGDFVGNNFSGKGEIVFPDGSRYTGDFHDNVAHGSGVFEYYNDTVLSGIFSGGFYKGKKHGAGVFTIMKVDGSKKKIEGRWKHGKFLDE